MHAELARFVVAGSHHAAPGVFAQGLWFRVGAALTAANHHGRTAQLGVAQEFDGGVKRIHVEVGDAAGWHGWNRNVSTLPLCQESITICPYFVVWVAMKTTLELPEPLFAEAKEMARREETTLRALVEEGLRYVLSRRQAMSGNYQLPDRSVGGDGLAAGMDWSRLSTLANESASMSAHYTAHTDYAREPFVPIGIAQPQGPAYVVQSEKVAPPKRVRSPNRRATKRARAS